MLRKVTFGEQENSFATLVCWECKRLQSDQTKQEAHFTAHRVDYEMHLLWFSSKLVRAKLKVHLIVKRDLMLG